MTCYALWVTLAEWCLWGIHACWDRLATVVSVARGASSWEQPVAAGALHFGENICLAATQHGRVHTCTREDRDTGRQLQQQCLSVPHEALVVLAEFRAASTAAT